MQQETFLVRQCFCFEFALFTHAQRAAPLALLSQMVTCHNEKKHSKLKLKAQPLLSLHGNNLVCNMKQKVMCDVRTCTPQIKIDLCASYLLLYLQSTYITQSGAGQFRVVNFFSYTGILYVNES